MKRIIYLSSLVLLLASTSQAVSLSTISAAGLYISRACEPKAGLRHFLGVIRPHRTYPVQDSHQMLNSNFYKKARFGKYETTDETLLVIWQRRGNNG